MPRKEEKLPRVAYYSTLPLPHYFTSYVTTIPHSRQLFARRRHQEEGALRFYQLYALSHSPSPNLSPEEIYEVVDDFIHSVAYATNQHLTPAPAFRNYPLVRVLEDYQGHALDVIQGDDPRPSQLPCHSECTRKPAKPRSQL